MSDQNVKALNTLLFPMHRGMLVLPDVAVAEIVDYPSTLDEESSDVEWYAGEMSWRNITIPLVSFDKMNGDETSDDVSQRKVVVVNSVHQRESCKFWAFIIQQAPTMQNINHEALEASNDVELGAVSALQAELLGEVVVFPDLEKIEGQIKKQCR